MIALKIAIYPGSFDPVTSGHLNIIRRAAKIFDKLIVCVMVNAGKNPMFTLQERVDLIRRVTNPEDGRSKVLMVTEKGAALIPELDKYRGWMDKLLTENMTEEEVNILIVLLKKLRNNANLRDQ